MISSELRLSLSSSRIITGDVELDRINWKTRALVSVGATPYNIVKELGMHVMSVPVLGRVSSVFSSGGLES